MRAGRRQAWHCPQDAAADIAIRAGMRSARYGAGPGSSLVDLLLGGLGMELGCVDGAVVEESLHLVDRHALAQHLGRSPVPEGVRVDMGEPLVPGGLLDKPPGGIGGEGGSARLWPGLCVAHKQCSGPRILAGAEILAHCRQSGGGESQSHQTAVLLPALAAYFDRPDGRAVQVGPAHVISGQAQDLAHAST
jgi:hypothetical protein